MEKRKLISLRSVLLRYLALCAVSCVLAAVLWFIGLLLLIGSGLFLPADAAANATVKAVQRVSEMTAERFDDAGFDPLCRYALFDGNELLRTNMDGRHLQKALQYERGGTQGGSVLFYTQYYMSAELKDGTRCLFQFDYSVPYADPALRGKLPDVQSCHILVGILLLVGVLAGCTHRTAKFLAVETGRLTEASRKVAEKKGLDGVAFTGAKVREYDDALNALQRMGQELTGSLQKQWVMEQKQREQIIQLSHELKTPLSIIEGNAELLAEDDLTAQQKEQVDAILRSTERTRNYLLKIRAEVQTPLKFKTQK